MVLMARSRLQDKPLGMLGRDFLDWVDWEGLG